MSRAPRGSMLVPALINCLMKEPAEGTECTFSRLAGDTKLGGAAEAPEGLCVPAGAGVAPEELQRALQTSATL